MPSGPNATAPPGVVVVRRPVIDDDRSPDGPGSESLESKHLILELQHTVGSHATGEPAPEAHAEAPAAIALRAPGGRQRVEDRSTVRARKHGDPQEARLGSDAWFLGIDIEGRPEGSGIRVRRKREDSPRALRNEQRSIFGSRESPWNSEVAQQGVDLEHRPSQHLHGCGRGWLARKRCLGDAGIASGRQRA